MDFLLTFRKNLSNYLIEAWGLGMFMVSASMFVILIEHPSFAVRTMIESAEIRRLLIGLSMGITAVLLIYSAWGKRSGAHINPAVTLTFLFLHRITPFNALWYIAFQFAGGILGVAIVKWLAFPYISDASVNFVLTLPGEAGLGVAFLTEFLLSLTIILSVLFSSNTPKIASYTGYMVGVFLTLAITYTAPFSGMSINPARTLASAINANVWTGWWIYFLAPISAMLLGGYVYRFWYRKKHGGKCIGMKIHLSGYQYDCSTYRVLRPKTKI